jgi:hypothetical protein
MALPQRSFPIVAVVALLAAFGLVSYAAPAPRADAAAGCDNDPAAQNWTMAANGTIQINGECMDITDASGSNGTPIEEWTCDGGGNQQWLAVNGELVNPASGKCLDDPAFNITPGTQLDLWTCNGGANQQWAVP